MKQMNFWIKYNDIYEVVEVWLKENTRLTGRKARLVGVEEIKIPDWLVKKQD